ncbi:MAG TPA: SBBP repeat-containing protein [Bryobacteraceae bacterium]
MGNTAGKFLLCAFVFLTISYAHARGNLPMSFEPNVGQADARVDFLARGNGYLLLLTPTAGTLCLSGPSKMSIKLAGSNPAAQAEGLQPLPGKSNYLIGNDRAQWRTNVANYAKVRYRNVYAGVDMIYYGNQRHLEYDLVVAPGVDPRVIQLAFSGIQSMRITPDGDLLLRVPGGEVRQHKPVVYQETRGARQSVEGNYLRQGNRTIGFKLGKYDSGRPLIIDPRLNYSTFVARTSSTLRATGGEEQGNAIAVDSSGSAYITGWTQSPDFPVKGAVQSAKGAGLQSAFVTKLNPAGSALVYSTYLGGGNQDEGRGIAVDSSGNAYVTGRTSSKNFPVTAGAFQPALLADGAAFVAKLNAAGDALLYSTYLGGATHAFSGGAAIAVDSAGNAYVTGFTGSVTGFPTTPGAFQNTPNFIFAAKFNPSASGASSLVYSTFLGKGSGGTSESRGIAVDAAGNAYIAGVSSQVGIATPGAYQTSTAGGDAFVTKLNAAGSGLIYSTYLGGSALDEAHAIALDTMGNAYVTGATGSTNFPTTPGAFQTAFQGGGTHVFVAKLTAAGDALAYSTLLESGGSFNTEHGDGIAVDFSGNAYVTGTTQSTTFPITADGFKSPPGANYKGFATKLNPAGNQLVYSSYIAGDISDMGHGVAVDILGNAYFVGETSSPNFPLTPGAFQAGATPCCSGKAFVTGIAADTGIFLGQTGLTFQSVERGGSLAPKPFRVFNATSHTLNFTVTTSTASGGPWLFAAGYGGGPLNPDQFATGDVIVSPNTLGAGDYYGQLRVDSPGAPNSPQFLNVVLNVGQVGTNPGPVVEPSGLVFAGVVGAAAPASQTVGITNLSSDTHSFSATGPSAITVNPPSGFVAPNQPLDIRVIPNSGLAAGIYRGSVVLQFPQDNAARTLDLLYVVAPNATCTPTKLLPVFTTLGANFTAPAAWPAPIDAIVTDDCGSPARTGSVVASFTNGDRPLNLASQHDGHWSATWAPRNVRSSMAITVTAQQPAANLQGTVQISGSVPDNPKVPAVGALVSSGSYSPLTNPSPGELVSVFGVMLSDGIELASALPLQTQMQSEILTLGGRPLPLVYTSPNQVNAMLPYGLTPGTTYQLIAKHDRRLSVPQPVTVVAAEPAIFSTDSSGKGQGDVFVYRSATEQILAAPGQPAKAGDILIIYCAGLGFVNPPIDAGVAVDRLIQTANPIGLTIGGVQAQVLFSGLTGGLTGLYQVNAVMPAGVSPGDAVPVVLTLGNVASPPVGMAVR